MPRPELVIRLSSLGLLGAVAFGVGCEHRAVPQPTERVELALATCGSSPDQIRGCVSVAGVLRVLQASQSCHSWETALCWNQVGSVGANSLITVTALPVGDANCPTGGSELAVGVDDGRDGQLQAAEIDGVARVCNGAQGPQGEPGQNGASCSVTDNGDGTKTIACEDGTEATVSDGAAGADGASCRVSSQSNGAKLIACGATTAIVTDGVACWDLNGNGVCDLATEDQDRNRVCDVQDCQGPTGSTGATGATEIGSLIRLTPEAAGANCPAGGVRIDAGKDANRNGQLDDAEVELTAYVCHGVGQAQTAGEDFRDCANGLDDDRDGLVDCADPDCAAAVCRNATGPCDVAERCDQGACPVDGFLGSDAVCRGSVGGCDLVEYCSGSGPLCPADAVQPGGFTCREAAGPCDLPEQCDGVSGACPSDSLVSSGTACRPSQGACDEEERCTGASARCPTDLRRVAGTVCRPAAGRCDLAESCDGVAPGCPADAYKPMISSRGMITVCRLGNPSNCDADEVCSGASPDCPPDQPASQGVVCRAAAGTCDSIAEVCDGISWGCPTDLDSCQAGEFCDGDSCAAEYANGHACSSSVECQSGYCADGVCCNTACSGGCEACNLAGSVGICTDRTPGTDLEAACGAYQCGQEGCLSACTMQAHCKEGYACYGAGAPGGGQCIDSAPLGASCDQASQCASGYCVDGVCCNTACTGGCSYCGFPATLGTCTGRPRGTDPENACGTYNCLGNGMCMDDPLPGDTGKPLCDYDTDCKTAYYCSADTDPGPNVKPDCVPDLPQGSTCSKDAECATGHCVQGVCCDSACEGGCQTCALAGSLGTCSNVPRGTDPKLACGSYYDCNGQGACVVGGDPDEDSYTVCMEDSDCKPYYYCSLGAYTYCQGVSMENVCWGCNSGFNE